MFEVVAIIALVLSAVGASTTPLIAWHLVQRLRAQDEKVTKKLQDAIDQWTPKLKAIEDIGGQFLQMKKDVIALQKNITAIQVKLGLQTRPHVGEQERSANS